MVNNAQAGELADLFAISIGASLFQTFFFGAAMFLIHST